MLDPRLQTVASFVRKDSRLADIGTDHALLPCDLVAKGHCPHAIASDIRKGPVEAASRSVSAAGLSATVDIRLGAGLDTVAAEEVDDIVIAGMGGETIAQILSDAPWTQNRRYRLILQPMTRAERLRRFLFEQGYCIEQEQIVDDGKHSYTVLCVAYSGQRLAPEDALCYVGKVPLPQGDRYLERICHRLEKQQQARPDDTIKNTLTRIEAYRRGEWTPWEE